MNSQGEMSSSWKCKEQVGLTDLCDTDILVEATEVHEMTQTKSRKRREDAWDRTGQGRAYPLHWEEDLTVILFSFLIIIFFKN